MRRGAGPRSSKLATGRLEFRSHRRRAEVLSAAALLTLLVLLVLVGRQAFVDSHEPERNLAGITRLNTTLQTDLAQARAELKLERATHAALVRQVAELNEQNTQLKSRLEFFNAQSGRANTSR